MLLGNVGLHGVAGGAEPLAVGAGESAGAHVFGLHVILSQAGCLLSSVIEISPKKWY